MAGFAIWIRHRYPGPLGGASPTSSLQSSLASSVDKTTNDCSCQWSNRLNGCDGDDLQGQLDRTGSGLTIGRRIVERDIHCRLSTMFPSSGGTSIGVNPEVLGVSRPQDFGVGVVGFPGNIIIPYNRIM